VLDGAVLAHLADVVCTPSRLAARAKVIRREDLTLEEVANAWRGLIIADHDVGRAHALHLIERIELHDEKAVIIVRSREENPLCRESTELQSRTSTVGCKRIRKKRGLLVGSASSIWFVLPVKHVVSTSS
jgi:hypothetical protein